MDGSKLEREANEKYSSLRLSHDVLLLSEGKGSFCSLFSVQSCIFPHAGFHGDCACAHSICGKFRKMDRS